MTWHFLEVWGLLLAAFAIGGLLGTLLYIALALSPLAEAQLDVADAVHDRLTALGAYFGRWRAPAADYGVHRDLPDFVQAIPATGAGAADRIAYAPDGVPYADHEAADAGYHAHSEALTGPEKWVEDVAEALDVADRPEEHDVEGAWAGHDPDWREGEAEAEWEEETWPEESEAIAEPYAPQPLDEASEALLDDAPEAGLPAGTPPEGPAAPEIESGSGSETVELAGPGATQPAASGEDRSPEPEPEAPGDATAEIVPAHLIEDEAVRPAASDEHAPADGAAPPGTPSPELLSPGEGPAEDMPSETVEAAETAAETEPPPVAGAEEPRNPASQPEAVAAAEVEPEPVLPPPVPPPVPAPAPPRARQWDLPTMRPLTLPGPRNGVPDNLQRIRGIGKKNEELLNSLGVYHFGQIAAWTPAEARWIGCHMAFPERIERDDWIGQAIILATGGDPGLTKATGRGNPEEPSVAA